MSAPDLAGACDARFSRVKDAFASHFSQGKALGAAVAVTIDGAPVVDLWGGFCDKARTRPWQQDTLVNVFSTTKGLVSTCALRLVDEGKLDLDAKVSRYWPEYSAAGKDATTVGMLLSHRAGLPAIRKTIAAEDLYSWDAMTSALAEETPWWEPGTKHAYHPVTWGWLVGEVIRRVSGRTVGAFFREEIAGPLGIDAHIGLDASNDARCADLRNLPRDPSRGPTLFEKLLADPTSMAARAFTNPISLVLPATLVSREWRGAEIPAANGHTTARALARLYGALSRGGEVDGVRVLSKDGIALAMREMSRGHDAVLDVVSRFGAGFMLPSEGNPMGPDGATFGHVGAGGSVGLADAPRRIGFGYVTNLMGTHIEIDPRAAELLAAVYDSLSA